MVMETDDRWSHTARQHGPAGAMSDAEAGRCVVIKPIVFTRRTFSLSCTYQPAVPVLTVIIMADRPVNNLQTRRVSRVM